MADRLAFLGFGEVGQAFTRGLVRAIREALGKPPEEQKAP